MATEDLLVSLNEREFILKALAEGQRADGRNLLEMRQVRRATAACAVPLRPRLRYALVRAHTPLSPAAGAAAAAPGLVVT